MNRGTDLPPLRVEQALRLLPDVDALAPLRAFLISTSRAQPPAEPYQTVGKRQVDTADLRHLVPNAMARVTDHLGTLYEAAVEALEGEQSGDLAITVRALLRAGASEEGVGRYSQAREWYTRALNVADGLRDRRPEIEALRHLGHLEAERSHHDAAARFYQRSFTVADDEMDHGGAALACLGMGSVSLARMMWKGAEAWFNRGIQHAAGDRLLNGQLHLGLGEAACGRGDLESGMQLLARARDLFEEVGNLAGIVRMLKVRGEIDLRGHRYAEALASFQEALAKLHRAGENGTLEMGIRLDLCRLYFEWGRLADVADEGRRAEELAIVQNLVVPLARLYVILGNLSGRQGDDTGFVFFEKAIELSRGGEASAPLEAEIYLEYGLFRKAFEEREEARAYLARAREILEMADDAPLLARVDAELAVLEAST